MFSENIIQYLLYLKVHILVLKLTPVILKKQKYMWNFQMNETNTFLKEQGTWLMGNNLYSFATLGIRTICHQKAFCRNFQLFSATSATCLHYAPSLSPVQKTMLNPELCFQSSFIT